jgi:hydrogenase 3 maturation protease
MFSDSRGLVNSLHAFGVAIPNDYEKHTLSFLKNTINSYKKPLIVGLGNNLKGDDAVAMRILESINQAIRLEMLSAGVSLENYLGTIAKKDNDFILIIDAAEFQDDKSFVYFFPEDITGIALGLTHNASLKLAVEYLQKDKASDILILAVKIYHCGFAEALSEPVQRAKIILQNFFLRNFSNK